MIYVSVENWKEIKNNFVRSMPSNDVSMFTYEDELRCDVTMNSEGSEEENWKGNSSHKCQCTQFVQHKYCTLLRHGDVYVFYIKNIVWWRFSCDANGYSLEEVEKKNTPELNVSIDVDHSLLFYDYCTSVLLLVMFSSRLFV